MCGKLTFNKFTINLTTDVASIGSAMFSYCYAPNSETRGSKTILSLRTYDFVGLTALVFPCINTPVASLSSMHDFRLRCRKREATVINSSRFSKTTFTHVLSLLFPDLCYTSAPPHLHGNRISCHNEKAGKMQRGYFYYYF